MMGGWSPWVGRSCPAYVVGRKREHIFSKYILSLHAHVDVPCSLVVE